MMLKRSTVNTWPLAVALCVLLASCGGTSAPTRFYVLAAMPDLAAEKSAKKPIRELSIGVGPITLPAHLDRSQIVTPATRHKLDLAEFDQWAEPLKDNFSRVLAENLTVLLGTDSVFSFPAARPIPVDYQIAVEVLRFDGSPKTRAMLIARWNVFSKDGRELLFTRRSSFSAPVKGQGFESLVGTLSGLLADLSREIATAVAALSS